MNDTNLALLEKNRDILSIRDLATGTIATYTLRQTVHTFCSALGILERASSRLLWNAISV